MLQIFKWMNQVASLFGMKLVSCVLQNKTLITCPICQYTALNVRPNQHGRRTTFHLKQLYSEPQMIAKKKKQDLLCLCTLYHISDMYHDIFKRIVISATIKITTMHS
ncbi:hypothetical protein PR048_008897, partial [Dryococelus australis]